MNSVEVLLDSSRGIYIPQEFAKFVNWHMEDKDREILAAGPDHELYWDTWAHVLDTSYCTLIDKYTYYLHQDGDLFAVCYGTITKEEYIQLFGETPEMVDLFGEDHENEA